MFINGLELINRLKAELDRIDPAKIDPEVTELLPVKLIICDVNMPVMNGWQTKRRMDELFELK